MADKLLNYIDTIKDKLNSEEYLTIMNQLNEIHKETKKTKLYKLTLVGIHSFVRSKKIAQIVKTKTFVVRFKDDVSLNVFRENIGRTVGQCFVHSIDSYYLNYEMLNTCFVPLVNIEGQLIESDDEDDYKSIICDFQPTYYVVSLEEA